MLTAVNPRGPASEPLRRCSVLPELIEDGIVAVAEAMLENRLSRRDGIMKSDCCPTTSHFSALRLRRGDNEN